MNIDSTVFKNLQARSKTSIASAKPGPKEQELLSKRSLHDIEPRITRRMSKMKSNAQSTCGKCIICLGNYEQDYGKLACGHVFCLECVKHWWKLHPSCPFCREEICYIIAKDQKIISFEDLPPLEKSQRDEDFIPHCELCWGQIQPFEEMNICTICRGVYWHRRCLPYRSCKWYCLECAGMENQQD